MPSGFATSGTTRYSGRVCVSAIGSAVCSNRLIAGVQPSWNVVGVDVLLQLLRAPVHEQDDLELLPEARPGRPLSKPLEVDEAGTCSGTRRTRSAGGSPRNDWLG